MSAQDVSPTEVEMEDGEQAVKKYRLDEQDGAKDGMDLDEDDDLDGFLNKAMAKLLQKSDDKWEKRTENLIDVASEKSNNKWANTLEDLETRWTPSWRLSSGARWTRLQTTPATSRPASRQHPIQGQCAPTVAPIGLDDEMEEEDVGNIGRDTSTSRDSASSTAA